MEGERIVTVTVGNKSGISKELKEVDVKVITKNFPSMTAIYQTAELLKTLDK
ncbi:hypothetical protein [Metabacillus sp. RGM 3146]|uniref:hypothetical protein n=1 Tax=Metabacillus sp. RGM 3146 TaxID=3401092 RepID=UPI003B9B79B7